MAEDNSALLDPRGLGKEDMLRFGAQRALFDAFRQHVDEEFFACVVASATNMAAELVKVQTLDLAYQIMHNGTLTEEMILNAIKEAGSRADKWRERLSDQIKTMNAPGPDEGGSKH